ncbi:hypothetical protein KRX56_01615 [Dermabacteraceae bacterium TAE3-ERU27]|nr:hypothetical protein [Dermabacteraceae bacterium TAE3-ERU27]
MIKMKKSIYDRAMSRSWPRLMTLDDLADFTGWTNQGLAAWHREGRLKHLRKTPGGAKNSLFIPRELAFAQFNPNEEGDDE